MSSSELKNSDKTYRELTPYYYCFNNRKKDLVLGEKPKGLSPDKAPSKRELKHYEHWNSYVNPVEKARELKTLLEQAGISQNQLAKNLGISRARITQLLNLLKLPEEKQQEIIQHGKDEFITERQLRKLSANKVQ